MTGECYINGYDVYVEFGVTPITGTFQELLKTVDPKEPITIDWENEDGEEVVFPHTPFLMQGRSFSLPVVIVAADRDDFFRKKSAFEDFLFSGAFVLFFPKLGMAYNCYYQGCDTYVQLQTISNTQVSARLNLKIREPNPSQRTLNKEEHAYGVIIDDTQANPDLTRIGNVNMAKSAVVNDLAMQGTLLNGYLKRFRKDNSLLYENGSTSILDGSAGDVVTHMPKFYYLIEDVSSTVHKVWVSPYPIDGFKSSTFTIGCFEAAMNNAAVYNVASGALWSIANASTVFRGGNNDATNDALQKGFLQRARTMQSRTGFYNAAQKRGASYGIIDYEAHKALFLLFITKYATLNSQKAFSAAKDANGYFTGGLGAGVTDVDSTAWGTWNGSYPLLPCAAGVGSGMVDSIKPYTLIGFSAGVDKIVSIPTFMGIENPFGHLWEWMQGININKDATTHRCYIYDGGAYEDIIGTKHSRYFDMSITGGWIKNMKLGAYFDLMAALVESGASSSTYFCDQSYDDGVAGLRGVLGSGGSAYGASAGLAFASSGSAVSYADSLIGSRLGYYGRVRPGV